MGSEINTGSIPFYVTKVRLQGLQSHSACAELAYVYKACMQNMLTQIGCVRQAEACISGTFGKIPSKAKRYRLPIQKACKTYMYGKATSYVYIDSRKRRTAYGRHMCSVGLFTA